MNINDMSMFFARSDDGNKTQEPYAPVNLGAKPMVSCIPLPSQSNPWILDAK